MLSEPWRSPPTATPATLNLDTHHDVLAQERPRDASNRVAVLDVRWPRDVGRAPAVDAGLAALVRLCGPALLTAVTRDATARSARSSAAQLLPEAPTSGLDLSAVTRPACDELPFGGDWSDSIRLGPARTAVLIGDVVGHAASLALGAAPSRRAAPCWPIPTGSSNPVSTTSTRASTGSPASYDTCPPVRHQPPPAATQILDHVLRTAPPDQPHRDDVTALVINRI